MVNTGNIIHLEVKGARVQAGPIIRPDQAKHISHQELR
jgi:hypothetical protein